MPFWNRGQKTKEERKVSGKGNESKEEMAREKHEQVLMEEHDAAERDAEAHEAGLERAEERRNEKTEEDRQRIKAHNAIDERTDNVLERHEKILSDRQNNKEADLESHEQGMEVAERRREENSQNELDRIKAHNAIDERTDNILERHDQVLSDRQHAKEADLESHEKGKEVAECRREEISQNELDRIKAHNAIDERTDNVLERHDQILSDRQHAKEADLESHEQGMEVAERRREETSQNELDRIKAHNAIDERSDNVLERHDQILSDRQHAKEADLDAHEKGMEVAELLRNEHAQNELDRIKAHNVIDERAEHVLDRHAKILSDDQHAKEADWKSHEEGLEAAERLRNELAQNELDRIKAHNAIEERTENVLERHDQILADRQEAEEADLKSHKKGMEVSERRREENSQNELDRIKAHNERTDNVLERHDQILADRQKAEEADLKSHEHGLEDAERRRTELSQNELDRIKAHNAIEERADDVLERHEQILSDRQDAKEQDLKSHEHGLELAERLRNEHSQSELDQIKAHNAIEEKSKHVLEQRNRVLTDQQKSAERDIHKHEKALGQAEKRRASIRDEQIQSIKAYNNISESEQRAAEKRQELAAASYHRLEEDLANTEARMQRAEKVKSETIKNRALAAKETLMNLNDVRKRHEEIERERERNELMHFERVDDNVNRGIARRDSALGDSMDLSKTRTHPNQSSHANSSEVLNE